MALDEVSLLVDVEGEATLGALESELRQRGYTLDLDDLAQHAALTVDAWLASGAPGARDGWRDPSDHLVAGLEARLRDDRILDIHRGPRRAVGPDLLALFRGMRSRYGTILRAHLRIHRVGVRRPDAPPFVWPRDPAMTPAESRLLDALDSELSGRR